MSDITTNDILTRIKQFNHNPGEILRLLLRATEEQTNGKVRYLDATTPVMLCAEANILAPASCLQEIQVLTRGLYSPAVDNWSDLFLHMDDIDYDELSDQPGKTTVTVMMSLEEIRTKAIPLNGNKDVKVIEFPAHTQITVNEYSLMFKYPVTIRINRYGNVSVKYNISAGGVLGNVESALIDFEYTRFNNMDVIRIPLEVVQVALTSKSISVSPSSGFRQQIAISDKFYKLKAFTRFGKSEQWIELDVTRRLKVLNKSKTTIQIQVDNGKLSVTIPSFYFNNGMVGTTIRLDIYTTKGELEHSLANYSDGSYNIRYFDHNNPNNEYAGLLGSLNVLKVYSTDIITGGRNSLTFDEMKDRVINRTTISEGIPITEKEITNKLADLGFSTVKVKDNVTERIFAASRLLPVPENNLTVTGIGCNVQTYQTTIAELSKLKTVTVSGSRLTVTPKTLYNVDNGVLTVVDDTYVETMTNPDLTAPENLAAWANANNLVFSPYYYVHDTSNNEYVVRPYRLDTPLVNSKTTVNENATLQLDAAINNYQLITKADKTGYTLLVGLTVGSNFKELNINNISLQMSFTDDGENNRYYVEGILATPIDEDTGKPSGDNYIYRFDLDTNWDIDPDHRLILKGSNIPVPLECDMDIFIIVKDFEPTGFSKTAMDSIIYINSLSNFDGRTSQYALVQERLNITLGKYMENLWQRSRTTIDEADYKRYEEDIPKLYKERVYQRDANGVIMTEYDADERKIVPILLHEVGDPVLDPDTGNQIFLHKVNDIVLENGKPVYKDGLRGLKRQFDLVVMDGLYYLTTHENTIKYARSTLDVIDTWVFDILGKQVKPELLERSDVLYHPKSTVGMIEVYVENGIKVLVQSDQSLFVRFFVDKITFANVELRKTIETTAKQVIQNTLQSNDTISVTDITSALKDGVGTNVMGIDVQGFMGDLYNTITVTNALTTPSIGKRLSVNSKLELVVEDDVEFEFINHSA